MNDFAAYTTSDGNTWNVLNIILGIVMVLSGGFILFTNTRYVKVVRAIASTWFIGNMCVLIGQVIILYTSPSDPRTSLWILFGLTIGLSLIFGLMSFFIPCLGSIMIGFSAGWSLWLIFSSFVASTLINLILSLIMSFVLGLAIYFRPELVTAMSIALISSTLTVFGMVYIVLNAVALNSLSYDALTLIHQVIYIVGIVVTLVTFGINLYFFCPNGVPRSKKSLAEGPIENTYHGNRRGSIYNS